MKKILAVLLAAMLVLSSSITVNAESIKDIFDTGSADTAAEESIIELEGEKAEEILDLSDSGRTGKAKSRGSVYSLDCGATEGTVTATLDEATGTLTISGTGPIKDYATVASVPWYNYRSSVEKIVVQEGVTRIGTRSMCNLTYLKRVELSSTVKEAGQNAFAGNSNLKEFVGSEAIEKIETDAFKNCTSLTSLDLSGVKTLENFSLRDSGFVSLRFSSNLNSIGQQVFPNCIENIVINNDNNYYKAVDSIVYTKDGKTLVFYPATKTAPVLDLSTLDSNLEIIQGYAIAGNKNITEIRISSNIKRIEMYSIYGNSNLLRVVFNAGPELIVSRAINSNCQKCKTVIIEGSYVPNFQGILDPAVYYIFKNANSAFVSNQGNSVFRNKTFVGYSTSTAKTFYDNNVGSQPTMRFIPIGTSVTVTFNANGGQGGPSSMAGTAGESFTIPSTTPTHSNKVFGGWATTSSATVPDYHENQQVFDFCADTTLYAVWLNSFTITYNANDSAGPSATNMPASQSGSSVMYVPNTIPQRTGYEFLGWSANNNSTSAQYQAGDLLPFTKSTILYAVWKASSTQIVYYKNDGTNSVFNTQTMTSGQTVNVITTKPTRTNYTFIGWATSADGNVVYYGGETIYDHNLSTINLYAVWRLSQYTVTYSKGSYDAQNMPSPTTATKRYGVPLAITSTEPTREGYVFAGWSETQNQRALGYFYGDYITKESNTNITLYPVWALDTVKDSMRFDLYDQSGISNYHTGYFPLVAMNLDTDGTPINTDTDNQEYLKSFKLWTNDPDTRSPKTTAYYPNTSSFLLRDTSNGNYHYNSNNYKAIFKESRNQYFVFALPSSATSTEKQFLPVKNDFYFALNISGNFKMPKYGRVQYNNDNYPMKYEFYGDDLVYVYIDGVKILNAGSGNGTITRINFETGQVTTLRDDIRSGNTTTTTTLRERFTLAYKEKHGNVSDNDPGLLAYLRQYFEDGSDTFKYDPSFEHDFKMFYAESYGISSNINVVFNIPFTGTNTLTIDPNGGKYKGSANIQTEQLEWGDTDTLEDPTTDTQKYTFNGWDVQGPGAEFDPNTKVFTMGYGDATATAQWTPTKHRLTVKPNGGIWKTYTSDYSTQIGYNETYQVPNPTRTGYTFNSWTKSGDGGSTLNGTTFTMGTVDVTLTAKWTPITYNIDFDPNGGSWKNSTSITHIQSVKFGHGNNVGYSYGNGYPTRTGYTFKGWKLSYASGSTQNYSTSATHSDSQTTACYYNSGAAHKNIDQSTLIMPPVAGAMSGMVLCNLCINQGDTAIMTAQWEPNVYHVVLDNQGAVTPGTTDAYYQFNTTKTYNSTKYYYYTNSDCDPATHGLSSGYYITKPTKTGYTFGGYYTEENGAGTQYIDSTGKFVNNLYKTVAADSTLYANWIPIVYHVILDNRGATTPGTTDAYYQFNTTKTYDSTTYYYYTNVDCDPATHGLSDGYKITKPTKTGYTFGGYYTEVNGGGTKYVDSAGKFVNNLYKTVAADSTIYANWTPIVYNITYTLNGGTVATANPTTYTVETPTFTLNNPTRTGYTFKGWTGTGLTSATTTVTVTKGSTGNRSYTANWTPIVYNITYTLNGGTVATANPTTYTVETPTFTLNNPTRTGYTFNGWTGTGLTSATTTVTVTKGSTGNRSYTANWTPIVYNITYTLNGGTVATANPTTYTIETPTFTLNNPTKTGYTFNGWTGTGLTSATTTVSVTKGSTGNRSYTANWTPIVYNITYTLNGGTVATANPTTYTVETETFTLNNPTRTGYTFNGWTGTGLTSATTTVTVTKGSTGDRAYTANWTANKFTVTFDPNGHGTPSKDSMEVTYDLPYGDLATISENGFTFYGWYMNRDCTGEEIKNDTIVKTDHDHTLYAKWKANGYTLTVKPNKGVWEGKTTDTEIDMNCNDIREISDPTRTGYTFTEWTKTGAGSTLIDKTFTMGYENATLTANWTPIVYNITYTLNGGTVATANPATYTIETETFTLNNPTKTGYIFNGWTGTDLTSETTTVTVTKGSTGDRAYTANWTPIVYNITYTLNGGTVATANPATYTIETPTFTLNNPTKTGYTFNGWTGTGLTPATNTVTVTKGSTGDRAYTANWTPNQYKVTFDPNGHGTPDPTEKTVTYDAAYGKLAEISATGYTFGGWYMTNDCVDDDLVEATTIVKTAGDHTLYAKWTPNEYTVIFDGNGSTSGEMTDQDFTYDEEQKLNKNEYEKTGYSFSGWKDDDGNTYTDEETVKNLTPEDGAKVTLKADWTPNQYKVTFDPNGHGTPDPTEKTVTYDAAYGKLAEISATGYTFGGWYMNADCTGAEIKAETIVKTAGDHTLYAKWTPNEYTVIFDGNGSTSGEMTDQDFTYDEEQKLTKNEYEKTGYSFNGWKDEDGHTYTDEQTVKNLTPEDEAEVVLKAQWTPNEYTVTFDPNGHGTPDPTEKMVTYDAAYGKLAEISATGYTFGGWYMNADCTGDEIKAETIVKTAHDHTLYAKWTPNQYTIIFDGNGSTSGEMTDQDFTYDEEQKLNKNEYEKTGYSFSGWKDDDGNTYTDEET
nr:InlB B-repeat-containing protein [Clostridiales bacterium]